MNLIVAATLSEPPTESLFFRQITYLAHKQLSMDCLIEVEREMKDAYYKFLLKQGLLDDIDDIIIPQENVSGLRLSHEKVIDPFIRLEAITGQNFKQILSLIQASIDPKNW